MDILSPVGIAKLIDEAGFGCTHTSCRADNPEAAFAKGKPFQPSHSGSFFFIATLFSASHANRRSLRVVDTLAVLVFPALVPDHAGGLAAA